MTQVKPPKANSNQSPEGFVWNIRISERVLIALVAMGSSFASGVAYSQVSLRPSELQPPPSHIEMPEHWEEPSVCPI